MPECPMPNHLIHGIDDIHVFLKLGRELNWSTRAPLSSHWAVEPSPPLIFTAPFSEGGDGGGVEGNAEMPECPMPNHLIHGIDDIH
eukprot:9276790-Pyramimonas_sp.AAC.1